MVELYTAANHAGTIFHLELRGGFDTNGELIVLQRNAEALFLVVDKQAVSAAAGDAKLAGKRMGGAKCYEKSVRERSGHCS